MSIFPPWHASVPHSLMYCTCNPLKAPFVVGAGLHLTALTICVPSDMLIHSSHILLSQQLAYLVTTAIWEEKGLPLRGTKPLSSKAHCALVGRPETRLLIASCGFNLSAIMGYASGQKCNMMFRSHPVDLEFWLAHGGVCLSLPMAFNLWECWLCCS